MLKSDNFESMSYFEVYPARQLRGSIVLPASKSISNRALMINALAGCTELPENLSDSDDTRAMLRALKEMPQTIDIGAAGTAMRFLSAYLSVASGEHVITGTQRMRQRPIGVLVDALRTLGADVSYTHEEGFPPLRIRGRELTGGELSLPANISSQYISALLMVGPVLRDGLMLNLEGRIASRPYIDMTLAMMSHSGAKVAWTSGSSLQVRPGGYISKPFSVENDWSAASYWYEMVALSQDESPAVTLPGLFSKSLQGDSAVCEIFDSLGVETTFSHQCDGKESVRLSRTGKVCKHLELDFINHPDLAQTVIVTCAMLGVTFRFSGLSSLRIKETDRIAALMSELRKLGIVIREDGGDAVCWNGECLEAERVPVICTYQDHRMAMAFAPACLRTGEKLLIESPQVVSKSYPSFWKELWKVGFRIETSSDSFWSSTHKIVLHDKW